MYKPATIPDWTIEKLYFGRKNFNSFQVFLFNSSVLRYFMKLLALRNFNLIPNPSPSRRRGFKALSRKERVG
jgi:hypothetical protein